MGERTGHSVGCLVIRVTGSFLLLGARLLDCCCCSFCCCPLSALCCVRQKRCPHLLAKWPPNTHLFHRHNTRRSDQGVRERGLACAWGGMHLVVLGVQRNIQTCAANSRACSLVPAHRHSNRNATLLTVVDVCNDTHVTDVLLLVHQRPNLREGEQGVSPGAGPKGAKQALAVCMCAASGCFLCLFLQLCWKVWVGLTSSMVNCTCGEEMGRSIGAVSAKA